MKALYAGSFDPITNGHLDIIQQAIRLFDELHIGVAINPDKHYLFSNEVRVQLVLAALKDEFILKNSVNVTTYSGMTVNYAATIKADVLVRGLRAVSDFDIEFQMTQFNRRLPPGINTVFLMPEEHNFYLSSTAIRGIAKMGGDVSQFVPECVAKEMSKL